MTSLPRQITESDIVEFIQDGAARLTPLDIQNLIADLPDIDEEIPKIETCGVVGAEYQLRFFAAVVESVWVRQYSKMPYRAALEAAFAVLYFHRDADLIPDSIGAMGFLDDAVIAATVLARNARAYQRYAKDLGLDWEGLRNPARMNLLAE